VHKLNYSARFRWVFCQLDALKKCKTRATLLNALKTLPRTLGDTYARILKNIDEEYQQHAQRALLWLAFSGRPLRIEEVAEAAVVDPRLSPPFNPEERLIDPRINILEILGSLVTISSMSVSRKVSGDNLPIEELSLAHFSVREYLTSERIQCSEASRFGTTDVGAHTFIAESCLQYIFHYDESDFKATSTKDLEDFPLLRYTCEFWYTHVKLIPLGSQKPIELVILKLFLSSTVLLSWLRIHCPTQPWLKPFEDSDAIGTALYHASNIGLQAVVQALLEEEANVNAKAEYGFTALHKAAYNGHEAVVQLLLEYEADIDAKPDNDYTALHQAAIKGHKAVLQLLLEHKADVNAKNNYDGETALYTAAYKGHEAVVQLLLEHKADVDAKASDGETALHKAAYNGHAAVVQLLLEHKAEVDAKANNGETALHKAAYNRHEAVVQLLLEHKAEVDAKANNGETALHAAAYNGHEAVVQLLLEHKVNVNAKSKYGFTALHHAAYNGHKEVVQLLLEYKADVDVKDNYNGETALHKAAMYGHEAVVRLLLKHKADVDAKSEYGFTALHQAAYNGRKEVVQLLLEYNADVYVKNNYDGEMALHYAAMNGHEAVVQLLKSKTPHKL
jgi:ankyrin repeat protein